MMRLLLVIAIALTYTVWHFSSAQSITADASALTTAPAEHEHTRDADHDRILQAFRARESGVAVQGQGRVIKVLPDDNDGSRHQRFILRLDQDMTLLLAHNIDLAPRLAGLQSGDEVAFSGTYEWNAKGGVVHWTHHDPRGQHKAGWLRYKGSSYQ